VPRGGPRGGRGTAAGQRRARRARVRRSQAALVLQKSITLTPAGRAAGRELMPARMAASLVSCREGGWTRI
jgi:hypothetical protein